MDQLISVLEDSLSQDEARLGSAALFLSSVSEANFSWLVQALALLLSAGSMAGPVRQQAGLQLKLIISRQRRSFSGLDQTTKLGLRASLLATLGTETWRPSTTALCIQEALEEDWDQLIPSLTRNILERNLAMIASIETLKCLCSGSDRGLVERNVDQVLTGLMFGVSQDKEETVVTGLQALLECLDCTAANFARKEERNYLMTVICNLTQSSSDQVNSLALECLNKIVSLFYPLMEEYMAVALIPISLKALQSRQEMTVMQAIEFWSNICQCELSLPDDSLKELLGEGSVSLVNSLHRIMMELDRSELDMEQWTKLTAATGCLSQLCQCLGSPVTEPSLQFISLNIRSHNWRQRHAAIISISTLLDMEDRGSLASVLASFLSMASSFLRDDNPSIRTAASYVILQVSDRAADVVISSQTSATVLGLASVCLQAQDPRLTEHGCLVTSNLLQSRPQLNTEEDLRYIEPLLQHLLSVTDVDFLTANSSSSLRQLAFSALSDIVDHCSHQHSQTQILKKYIPGLLERFHRLLSPETSSWLHVDISFNCSIFNSILLGLERETVLSLAPDILPLISKMFDLQQLHEDAILILRALVDQLGYDMRDYIPNIVNVVIHYTQSLEDSQVVHKSPDSSFTVTFQVSLGAVGMIGDLYSKASQLMSPYSDQLVQNLLTILSEAEVDPPFKSVCLTSLTDLVLHSDCVRYLEHILRTIFDTNILQTGDTLLSGLELLSSLLQTSDSENQQVESVLSSWAGRTLNTVMDLIEERDLCDSTVRNVVGILGDLASRQPRIFSCLSQLNVRSIRQVVLKGQASHIDKTKSVSLWAARQLLNVYNNNVVMAEEEERGQGHVIVKKAKVCDEVFYDVKVTVTNKQFITQNIETENVTIRLNTSTLPPVIECSDVHATVKLPRQRKKRTAVPSDDFEGPKKCKEDF